MTMVRKQVYVTQDQEQVLKRLSDEFDMTEAEIIRRGIELVKAELGSDEARRKEAGRRLIALLRHHYETHPMGTTREWKREDAYDDDRY